MVDQWRFDANIPGLVWPRRFIFMVFRVLHATGNDPGIAFENDIRV